LYFRAVTVAEQDVVPRRTAVRRTALRGWRFRDTMDMIGLL
jgi:hypothetical protein